MPLTKASAGVLNIDDLYGFRNRIINGDMRIDQRNSGANTTISSATSPYTLDRWIVGNGGGISANVALSTDAPAGFNNSLKITIVTTGSSANSMYMFQKIEGFNVADLGWGTASAATCTLSFWVKSSINGSYNSYIFPINNDRSYIAPFTINTANTWEYKTITILGDTSGTWLSNTSTGIQISFGLSGNTNSSNTSTTNQWFSGTKFIDANTVNFATNSGATWQITGVQFEKGSVATPFERRPYGMELALCQRYFQQYNSTGDNSGFLATGYCDTTSRAFVILQFPVYMRTAPSLTVSSATVFGLYNVPADSVAATSITLLGASTTVSSAGLIVNSSGVFTAGRGTLLKDIGTSSSGKLQFSSEL